MRNWFYIIIAYAFFFSLCVALMVNDRIHKKKEDRDKIGKDILFCFLGALLFPVVVYIGLEGLYRAISEHAHSLQHMVACTAIDKRVCATRVVAHHPTDAAAVAGRCLGAEEQSVRF